MIYMQEMTILDSRMVEFKYDHMASRFLTLVLYDTKNMDTGEVKRGWDCVRNENADRTTNQVDAFLLEEKQIYENVLNYAQSRLAYPGYLGVFKPTRNQVLTFGVETGMLYAPFQSPYELAGFIMKAAMNIESYDNYAILEGGLMIDYENSKGNPSSTRMMSSDEMEKYMLKLGKSWRIDNIRFTNTYPSSFQLHKMGRFLIRREFYYVLKIDKGYLLYEDGETLYKTAVKRRAMKFISEDEALDYVTGHMNNNSVSFEVERVYLNEILERCIPAKKDAFKEFTGTIEETFPFPSNLSK